MTSELNTCALLSHVSKHNKALKYCRSAFLHFSQTLSSVIEGINTKKFECAESKFNFLQVLTEIHSFFMGNFEKGNKKIEGIDWIFECNVSDFRLNVAEKLFGVFDQCYCFFGCVGSFDGLNGQLQSRH